MLLGLRRPSRFSSASSYSNKEDDVRQSVRLSVCPYQKFFCDASQMQKEQEMRLRHKIFFSPAAEYFFSLRSPATKYFFSLRSQERNTWTREKHTIVVNLKSKYVDTFSLNSLQRVSKKIPSTRSLSLVSLSSTKTQQRRRRIFWCPSGQPPARRSPPRLVIGIKKMMSVRPSVRPSVCPSMSKVVLRQITDAKRSKK